MIPTPSDPAQGFPRRIKIVRVIARLNIGGASLHVINLCAHMDKRHFETILVAGKENPGEGSMWDLAVSKGLNPISIPEIVGQANLKLRDFKALVKLYRLLRREKPDIVDTHTAKAGFLGRLAAKLAGVPAIIHTYHGHVLRKHYGRFRSRALQVMERGLAGITDLIIAVSQETKQELVEMGVAREDMIMVVPLGFDLQPFLDSGRLKGQFRQEIGVVPSLPLIGIVGRLFPVKNHRLFLEAAALLSAKHPNARFVVVGDGILRQDLLLYCKELSISDKVFFLGWRRDLPAIYADLDVLVVSSHSEGTPVAAIEAMSAGCPVVATRVGGTPALIENGRNGRLVPPGDPGRLSQAICSILRQAPQEQGLGRAARDSARHRFALDRFLHDMDRIYRELVLKRARPASSNSPRP